MEVALNGPIPYRAPGYLEGIKVQGSDFGAISGGWWPTNAIGKEIVYDFARFERATFWYDGGYISDAPLGIGYSEAVGTVQGFSSWQNINEDYSGDFVVGSFGLGFSILYLKIFTLSAGTAGFFSPENPVVRGSSDWVSISGGVGDLVPIFDLADSILTYYMEQNHPDYVNDDNTIDVQTLFTHLIEGDNSPWIINAPVGLDYIPDAYSMAVNPFHRRQDRWSQTSTAITKYAAVYTEVHEP